MAQSKRTFAPGQNTMVLPFYFGVIDPAQAWISVNRYDDQAGEMFHDDAKWPGANELSHPARCSGVVARRPKLALCLRGRGFELPIAA